MAQAHPEPTEFDDDLEIALRNAVIDQALDCVVIIDAAGKVIEFNPAAEAMFGHSRQAVLGRRLAEILIPERFRAAHEAGMTRFMQTGEGPVVGTRIEVYALHADGHEIPVELAVTAVELGGQAFFTAYMRDISDRKQMEADRKRYEYMLEQAQRLAQMGSWEWSPITNEVVWSDATYVIFGVDPADGPWDFETYNSHVHPDDIAELNDQVQDALARGDPYEVEHRITRADGGTIIIEGRGAALRNDDGEIERLLGTVRDITALREAQQELTRAKETAEAANAAKSHFLASMSHEMRTPLNGVIGLLDLLEDSPLAPKQGQHVARARSSAETLLALINDVLDLSKIEAGEMTLDPAPFDPREMLRQAVDIVTVTASAKTLPIRLHVATDVPRRLEADSAHLRQVVTNLLSNAVKFTHKGEVVVHAAYDRTAKALSVKVIDTGIGIPQDKLERLFDRFTQADPGLSRRYGGAGLGLAICKELVTLMGGDIGVESRPGTGSRFWFHVPVTPVAEEARPQGAPDLTARDHGQLDARILLAEDSPTNALVTKTHLQDAGAVVDIAFNGLEAVEAVKSADYDLILMDVSMPEMDGLAAAGAIRAMDGPKSAVPIIALTAHALRGDREQCLEAGMDDYLVKPVKRPDLLRAVRERLAAPPRPDGQGAASDAAVSALPLQPEAGAQDWREEPELYRIVLEAFAGELRARLDGAAAAAKAGDRSTLSREAHTIKGAALNVGAIPLSRAALTAEKTAESGEHTGETLLALQTAGETALRAIEERLAQHAPEQAKGAA